MYGGFYNQRRGRRSFSRFGRGRGFRVKTFNPFAFINAPKVMNRFTEKEYVIQNSFSDFDISGDLKKNIAARGYTVPTPIQDQGIPVVLSGRDLIGIANTGTGKTAAFLIPLIDKVFKDGSQRVLIVTPTRELADQIKEEFFALSRGMHIYSALVIGGVNIRRQTADLSRNPNFVIGTPGRLKDLIGTRSLNLGGFATIVLDEADRMVDIGFIADVRYIVSLLNPKRQSLFFSATIDGKVKDILRNFVQDPVTVSVKKGETVENVEQKIIQVTEPGKKFEQFHNLLKEASFEKVLVFGRTKHGVQRLADELNRRGLRSDSIHGNKRQSQRLRTLENFKRNNIRILVATDVASRGLDIPNVSHVINYDLPESQEAYIHRIGRTGRAGKPGQALTFVE